MKVYYKLSNNQESTVFENIQSEREKLILEKYKYKVMWDLRSIENEINEEKGLIIVTLSRIEIKNFTEELTDKIHDLLAKSRD